MFTYILFDGLTFNTRGYFASCVYFADILRYSEIRKFVPLDLLFHLEKSRQNLVFSVLRPENL